MQFFLKGKRQTKSKCWCLSLKSSMRKIKNLFLHSYVQFGLWLLVFAFTKSCDRTFWADSKVLFTAHTTTFCCNLVNTWTVNFCTTYVHICVYMTLCVLDNLLTVEQVLALQRMTILTYLSFLYFWIFSSWANAIVITLLEEFMTQWMVPHQGMSEEAANHKQLLFI